MKMLKRIAYATKELCKNKLSKQIVAILDAVLPQLRGA